METSPAFEQRIHSAPPAPLLRGLIGVGDGAQRPTDLAAGDESSRAVESPLFPAFMEQRQVRAEWPGRIVEIEEEGSEDQVLAWRAPVTDGPVLFGGLMGTALMKALESAPIKQPDKQTASALAFLDGLIHDVEAKGYDKRQEKHLRDVQKALDSHRTRGNKLAR